MNQSTKNNPNPIDQHVGNRMRMRRSSLDITQEALANELGVSFQQVQKYENGANRISASKLYQVKQALDVDISYFFEGYTDSKTPLKHATESFMVENKYEATLLSSFRQLTPKKQRSLLNLLEVWS